MTDPDVGAVAELLRAAADTLILPRFGELDSHDIYQKSSPDDLVTIADREAELWLTPRLRELVDCDVIGEEACAAAPELRNRATADKAWTVDPVDGTGNFVKGKPSFCTMVALLEHGTPISSWIWVPLEKTLYFAKSGEGAFRTNSDGVCEKLTLAARTWTLAGMQGGASAVSMPEPRRSEIRARLRTLPGRRFPGSSGILGTQIASGDQQFLMQARCTPWDHAPVDLLCREAGAYSAMLNDGAAFNAGYDAGFMIAPDEASWSLLRDHIGAI